MKHLLLLLVFVCQICFTQDIYRNYRATWLSKASQLCPELTVVEAKPLHQVEIVADSSSFQHLNGAIVSDMSGFYATPLLQNKGDLILDFGQHMVGSLKISIKSTIALHGPVQVRFKFGETLQEIHSTYGNYTGVLSRAWLQEEIITLHEMPTLIELPRRYAFRFMQIEILSTAAHVDYYINSITCSTVSSANKDALIEVHPLPEEFEAIAKVSIKTLHDCMQTVFEDGPKRDRRQWIGDLKLQALANYYTYNNIDLVKRGLYLIAATSSEGGLVHGNLFERPEPHPESGFPIDYCLLFNTILLDYYRATNDKELINELWVVAKEQVSQIIPFINDQGLFLPSTEWWYFVDWNSKLDKSISLQGIAIYAMEKTLELSEILGKQDEVKDLPNTIDWMKKASRKYYYDKKLGLFVGNDSAKQVSTASQTWMILSGTVDQDRGRQLFENLRLFQNEEKPVSPYMYHYVLEAMMQCEMYKEAKNLILYYWGGMVAKGADTFWEVYDPHNDFLSPYGSHVINSYCHAWSCTPVYFLRKYEKQLFNREINE